MELSKQESESGERGGLRLQEVTYDRGVFLIEWEGHWGVTLLALRRWLNESGRGDYKFKDMRNVS